MTGRWNRLRRADYCGSPPDGRMAQPNQQIARRNTLAIETTCSILRNELNPGPPSNAQENCRAEPRRAPNRRCTLPGQVTQNQYFAKRNADLQLRVAVVTSANGMRSDPCSCNTLRDEIARCFGHWGRRTSGVPSPQHGRETANPIRINVLRNEMPTPKEG